MFPYGNVRRFAGRNQEKITVREYYVSTEAKMIEMFPYGNTSHSLRPVYIFQPQCRLSGSNPCR